MEKSNKIISNLGVLLILFLGLLTIGIWIFVRYDTQMFNNYDTSTHSLGQLTGLVGMTLFSLSFILTSRLKFIEKYFGGLDKVYRVHHIIGALAFILLLFHPILLVLKFIPSEISRAAIYLLPSENFSINLGIFALLGLILLIVLTFFINLKYQSWKFSHKFMGFIFILATFHVFLVDTDITYYPILKYYMIIITLIGVISFFYTTFFKNFLIKKYLYKVESIERKDSINIINLKPLKEKLKFVSGQFAYIKFKDKILHESHPFTIASSPNEENLKFAIKSLRDYTSKLSNLKIGTIAKVEGPYGKFNLDNVKDMIWISGGIGITPFLSFLKDLAITQNKVSNIDFFYCIKNEKEALFLEEILNLAKKIKNIRIIPFYSDTNGYLTLEKIEKISSELKNKSFYLCGPPVMIESIVKELNKKGIKDIHREDFNLK